MKEIDKEIKKLIWMRNEFIKENKNMIKEMLKQEKKIEDLK